MKNYIKYIVIGLVALLIGIVIGAKFFGTKKEVLAGSSATGVTNSSPRIAQMVLSGGTYDSAQNAYAYTNSSTTPLCNFDGNDRYVVSVDYVFPAIGAVSSSTLTSTGYNLALATSSSNSILGGNTNYLLQPTVSISTTTPFVYQSTTTPGTVSVTASNRVWANGSCMVPEGSSNITFPLILRINYIAG